MNTRTFWSPRYLVIGVGVTICVGVGIVASCTPPGEQDSQNKTATATSVQAVKPSSTAATKSTTKPATPTTRAASKSTTTSTKKKRPKATGATIYAEPVDSVPSNKQPGVIDCISPAVIKPETLHLSCVNDSDVINSITWSKWTEKKAEGKGQRVIKKGKSKTVTIKLSDPQPTSFGVVYQTMLVDDTPVTGISS